MPPSLLTSGIKTAHWHMFWTARDVQPDGIKSFSYLSGTGKTGSWGTQIDRAISWLSIAIWDCHVYQGIPNRDVSWLSIAIWACHVYQGIPDRNVSWLSMPIQDCQGYQRTVVKMNSHSGTCRNKMRQYIRLVSRLNLKKKKIKKLWERHSWQSSTQTSVNSQHVYWSYFFHDV